MTGPETTDNTDAMPTAAPRVTDFAYPAFYRAMVERERMQVVQRRGPSGPSSTRRPDQAESTCC